MTENEAKVLLCQMYLPQFDEEEKQALTMAIQALEEIQQYRAIGTVEGCEKAMDFELAKQDKSLAEVIDEYLEYIKIGTIEEFKALKEKEKSINKSITFLEKRKAKIINEFADWCYINGIDFSYMRKATDTEPFVKTVIQRFNAEKLKGE